VADDTSAGPNKDYAVTRGVIFARKITPNKDRTGEQTVIACQSEQLSFDAPPA